MNISRYLTNFDLASMKRESYDVIIIGGGISGLYTALQLDDKYRILIIAKENVENSNTALAQGGIAVSLGLEDSTQMHFNDTIYAGAGLCNEEAVWILVEEARENIENLVKYGVDFDRDSLDRLSLTREGAHSINRIIHAGDTTGKTVLNTLSEAVLSKNNIIMKTRYFAADILKMNNACQGMILFDMDKEEFSVAIAPIVVCSTGGYGQIYSTTTNPDVSTGDGAGMAYRAGAELSDLEFVQFHPTVLYHKEKPGFLISEALRGEGAELLNINGEKFMSNYHPLLELAPRDIVARAIFAEMKKTGSEFVYLDIRNNEHEYIKSRFPNIYNTLLEIGIDFTKDLIPVAPTEHYCMGGIRTDKNGRTNISGLYACGECACNGIHGANRLASNSLLEGLVFGRVIARDINENIDLTQRLEISAKLEDGSNNSEISLKYNSNIDKLSIDFVDIRKQLKEIMTRYVGIIRDRDEMIFARNRVQEFSNLLSDINCTKLIQMEVVNMISVALLVIESAIEREESRGAHYRTDFPSINVNLWTKNVIKKVNEE